MLNNYSWLGWTGIPLLGLLYLKKTKIKRFNANLLLGGIILTLLIVFNPLAYKYLGKLWTVDLICRLIRKPPIHAIAVLGTFGIVLKLLLEKIRSARSRKIAIVLLVFAASVPALLRVKTIRKEFQVFDELFHQQRKNFRYINAYEVQKDPLLVAIRKKLKPGETLFSTTVLTEIFLCPISNVRIYDLYKDNWASMNQPWSEHLERHENTTAFYDKETDFERFKMMHDLHMKYVITELRQLHKPFFSLIAHSEHIPRLFLYEVAGAELLNEQAQ